MSDAAYVANLHWTASDGGGHQADVDVDADTTLEEIIHAARELGIDFDPHCVELIGVDGQPNMVMTQLGTTVAQVIAPDAVTVYLRLFVNQPVVVAPTDPFAIPTVTDITTTVRATSYTAPSLEKVAAPAPLEPTAAPNVATVDRTASSAAEPAVIPPVDLSPLTPTIRRAAIAISDAFAAQLIAEDVTTAELALLTPPDIFEVPPFCLSAEKVGNFRRLLEPVELSRLDPVLLQVATAVNPAFAELLVRSGMHRTADAIAAGYKKYQASPFGLTAGKAIDFIQKLKSRTASAPAEPKNVEASVAAAAPVPQPIAPASEPCVSSDAVSSTTPPSPAPIPTAPALSEEGVQVVTAAEPLRMAAVVAKLDDIATDRKAGGRARGGRRFPVFGRTTVGKSTSATFLRHGVPALRRVEEHGLVRYEAVDPSAGFRIGGGLHAGSCTKLHKWLPLEAIPGSHLDDIPGDFDDDELDRIVNCVVKEQALHGADADATFSPIVVMSMDVITGKNGGALRDFVEEFAGVFHGKDGQASRSLYNRCVTFFITKVNGLTRDEVLNQLGDFLKRADSMVYVDHEKALIHSCQMAALASLEGIPKGGERERVFVIDLGSEVQRAAILSSMNSAGGALAQDFHMTVPLNVEHALGALDGEEHRKAEVWFEAREFGFIAKSVQDVRRVSSVMCVIPPYGLLKGVNEKRKAFYEVSVLHVANFLGESVAARRSGNAAVVCDWLMALAEMERTLKSAMLDPVTRCAVCQAQTPNDAQWSMQVADWDKHGLVSAVAAVKAEIERAKTVVQKDVKENNFSSVQPTALSLAAFREMVQQRPSLTAAFDAKVIRDAEGDIDQYVTDALKAMQQAVAMRFGKGESVRDQLGGLSSAVAVLGSSHRLAAERALQDTRLGVRQQFDKACAEAQVRLRRHIRQEGEASVDDAVKAFDLAFNMGHNNRLDELLCTTGCQEQLVEVFAVLAPEPGHPEQIGPCSEMIAALRKLWKDCGGEKASVLEGRLVATQQVFQESFTQHVEEPWRAALKSVKEARAVTLPLVQTIETAIEAFHGGYHTTLQNRNKYMSLVRQTAAVVTELDGREPCRDGFEVDVRRFAAVLALQRMDYDAPSSGATDINRRIEGDVLRMKTVADAIVKGLKNMVTVIKGSYGAPKPGELKSTTNWVRLKQDLELLGVIATCGSPKRGNRCEHQHDAANARQWLNNLVTKFGETMVGRISTALEDGNVRAAVDAVVAVETLEQEFAGVDHKSGELRQQVQACFDELNNAGLDTYEAAESLRQVVNSMLTVKDRQFRASADALNVLLQSRKAEAPEVVKNLMKSSADNLVGLLKAMPGLVTSQSQQIVKHRCLELLRGYLRCLQPGSEGTITFGEYENAKQQLQALQKEKELFKAFADQTELLAKCVQAMEASIGKRAEDVAALHKAFDASDIATVAQLHDAQLMTPAKLESNLRLLASQVNNCSNLSSMIKYARDVSEWRDRLPPVIAGLQVTDGVKRLLRKELNKLEADIDDGNLGDALKSQQGLEDVLKSAPEGVVEASVRAEVVAHRREINEYLEKQNRSAMDCVRSGNLKRAMQEIVALENVNDVGTLQPVWDAAVETGLAVMQSVQELTTDGSHQGAVSFDQLQKSLNDLKPFREAVAAVPSSSHFVLQKLNIEQDLDTTVRAAERLMAGQSKQLAAAASGRTESGELRYRVSSPDLPRWVEAIERYLKANVVEREAEAGLLSDLQELVNDGVRMRNEALLAIEERATVDFKAISAIRANSVPIVQLQVHYDVMAKRAQTALTPPDFGAVANFPAAVDNALVRIGESVAASIVPNRAVGWPTVGRTHLFLNAARVAGVGVTAFDRLTEAISSYARTTREAAMGKIEKEQDADADVLSLVRMWSGYDHPLNPSCVVELERLKGAVNAKIDAACNAVDVNAAANAESKRELAVCLSKAYAAYELAPSLGNDDFMKRRIKAVLVGRKEVLDRLGDVDQTAAFFADVSVHLATLKCGLAVVAQFKTYFASAAMFDLPTRSIDEILSLRGCTTVPANDDFRDYAKDCLECIRKAVTTLMDRAKLTEPAVVAEVLGRLIKPSAGYLAAVPSKEDMVQMMADVVFLHWYNVDPTDPSARYIKTHDVQIFAVLRLLGWDRDGGVPKNHLIEVPTGEGKSVVVGLTAAIHAIRGKTVHCICYSDCLRARDEKGMKPLLKHLGVAKCVKYQTVEDMCESFVGQLRDAAVEVMMTGSTTSGASPKEKDNRVLIIDEVDVFFTKHFLGNTYNAGAIIRTPELRACIEYFWANRTKSVKELLAAREAELARASVPSGGKIIDWGLQQLANNVHKLDVKLSHVIDDGKLMYVDANGNRNPSLSFPNRTVYQVMREIENGALPPNAADALMGIVFFCGRFSYAELPNMMFGQIVGVTGTLSTLDEAQLALLSKDYNIQQRTYIKSLYASQRNAGFFSSEFATISNSRREWRENIVRKMKEIAEKKTSALAVYFEDDKAMNDFVNSPEYPTAEWAASFRRVESTDKPQAVNAGVMRATTPGMVTFFTALHGRGLDFRFDERQLPQGFSVLQTFYSDSDAEEVQTMGRCARQGKKGTYYLALCNEDLQRSFNITVPTDPAAAKAPLVAARKAFTTKYVEELVKAKEEAMRVHEHAMKVVQGPTSIFNNECASELRVATIVDLNVSQMVVVDAVIMVLDGTGSMHHGRWEALAKATQKYLRIMGEKRTKQEREQRFWVTAIVCEHCAAVINKLDGATLEAAMKVDIKNYKVPGYNGLRTDFNMGWRVVKEKMAAMLARVPDVRFTLMWLTDGDEDGGANEIRTLLPMYQEHIDAYYQYVYDRDQPVPPAIVNRKLFTDAIGADRVKEFYASSKPDADLTAGTVNIEAAFEAAATVDAPVFLRLTASTIQEVQSDEE